MAAKAKAKLERGLMWRGDIIWIRTDPVTGKARSTGCHDPRAARNWRAERERLATDPRYAASLTATVESWVKLTLAHKKTRRSAGTLHMYGVKLGHVARIFGAASPLSNITSGTVDKFMALRSEEGAKNNTISRELTCLRQMLRLAKRAGAYQPDISEVMPVDFSPGYKPVTRTLGATDLPKLLAALRSDQERAWVCLALAVAADVGDVERALPEDYDPVRQVMRVRGTKTTTRDAEIPVLEQVKPLLEFALPFLPVSWPRVSHELGDACARAGLSHLSPKDLRRSICSWLIASGVPQPLVSRFMRHKSDAMVRLVYGQMTPVELGSLIAKSVTPALHQHARPLGGMADAGDLKGHLSPSTKQPERVYGVPTGRDRAHSGTVRVTPALHGAGALTRAGLIDPRDRLRLGFAAFRLLGAA